MTKPVRLQLSRRKGYSLQAATIAANGLPAVNVARPGPWGNPFRVGNTRLESEGEWEKVEDVATAVRFFREMLAIPQRNYPSDAQVRCAARTSPAGASPATPAMPTSCSNWQTGARTMPDAIWQEHLDRYYWQHGPCCAGCDHWRSRSSLVGECTRSAPVSGTERMAMLGISWSSLPMGAGHALTRRDHSCGEFRDEFDWSSLSLSYRKQVGAPV